MEDPTHDRSIEHSDSNDEDDTILKNSLQIIQEEEYDKRTPSDDDDSIKTEDKSDEDDEIKDDHQNIPQHAHHDEDHKDELKTPEPSTNNETDKSESSMASELHQSTTKLEAHEDLIKDGKAETSQNKDEVKVENRPRREKRPSRTGTRKMRFEAKCVEDLPKDMKKLAKESKIPNEELDAHFDVLLNILHFFTKKVFVTKDDELEAKNENRKSNPTQDNSTSTSNNNNHEEPHPDTRKTSKPEPPAKKGFWPFKGFLHRSRSNSKEDVRGSISPSPDHKEGHKDGSKSPKSRSNESHKGEEKHPEEHKEEHKEEHPPRSPQRSPQPPRREKKPSSDTIEIKIAETERAPPLDRKARSKSRVDMSIEYYFIKQNPKNLFKSLRKAGKGGYGSVFTAKAVAENQMVAIKKMKHSNSKERAANYNEVKFLRKCDHPNIVKFLSCYEYKDECWLVMEYLEGGTLTDARRGHDFEENEIAYVAKELLKGLAFVHSVGLIHRDLKSSNIMMSIMGDIKLIDFGLCTEAKKAKPTMLGSPHWMPPEMILRLPHSYTADIWSFGISLLELTNKHPPTAQHKVKAMWVSAVGKLETFEEPEKWSDNYKDFMSKCLEKDPDQRSSAEELLKHPFLEQAANTRKVMRKILTEVFVQRAIGLF